MEYNVTSNGMQAVSKAVPEATYQPTLSPEQWATIEDVIIHVLWIAGVILAVALLLLLFFWLIACFQTRKKNKRLTT